MVELTTPKKRVIVYVDGFNFYYGLKKAKWKKLYWLDMVKFCDKMMLSDQELVEVNYFSAPPIDRDAASRQNLFFNANKMNLKFKLLLGRHQAKSIKCRECGYEIKSYEEKETDVRVAIKMLEDVFLKRCDVSIIVSADSDMGPSVDSIRTNFPHHQICAFFPPTHYSRSLEQKCHKSLPLQRYKARFEQSMLPDEVTLSTGYVVRRPTNWK